MDPLAIRDRFPGVTVTLTSTMNPPAGPDTARLTRSKTDSFINVPSLHSTELTEISSRLPPAVAIVPKEDWKSYLHSKKVNNYLIGNTLGEGSFAKVKEAFHTLVGEKVAMKIIDKKKAMQDPYVAKNFKREAKLLQKLRHPNIIRLFEVIETENNYYLITELCSGGELMKHIYKFGKLSEDETRKFIRQIVSAVDHLHRAGLIHRDLKVENLLLDGNMDVKLIDFGLSNEEITLDETGREIHCRTQCGSPAYAAPELLGQKQYDNSVDIWSIGVNMYAMLTGCLPFTVEPFNITTLHAKMLQNKMNPIPDHLSQNCQDLLKKMLTPSPDSRITMDEIFAHPWLSESHSLQFGPAPYPNTITQAQINTDIVDHIADVLRLGTPMEIKQDLITNRATSLYATYHLLASRLARYEKEYPSKVVRPHRRSLKKVSRDLGFYDYEDDDLKSTASVPTRAVSRRKSRRPVSEDLSDTFLPPQLNRRRLSDIAEERRASMPSTLLESELDKLKKKTLTHPLPSGDNVRRTYPRSPNRHSHPQPFHTLPPAHINNMSPSNKELFDIELSKIVHGRPRVSSVPKELSQLPTPASAWNSNPPSRSNSRASLYSRLPSIKGTGSQQSVDLADEEDIEFHNVSPDTPSSRAGSFFLEPNSPSPISTPLPSPVKKTSGNAKKRGTSLKRKNGIVIPPSGDFELKTQFQISAIISELLRVAHVMKMKTAEPLTTTTLHCTHRSVDMTISIRKKSVDRCTVHFEWLSGGSYQLFNETCRDMITKSQM